MNDTAERVRFELASGSVRASGGERLMLLPSSVLEELGNGAGLEIACALSRAMGGAIGKAVATKLGSNEAVRASSLEAMVHALGSELGLAGWGALSLERWGRAMVMVVEHAPVQQAEYVAATLEGALREATGRDVHCWPLGGTGTVVRVLVASEQTIGRARAWLTEGIAWGDVLVRLQASGGAA